MSALVSIVASMLVLFSLMTHPVAAQSDRPSRATCEAAVRAGLQALTQQPADVVEALITDWGTAETAAALGLPDGCRVPVAVPAIEPLDEGGFMICLWWDPKTGALGEALRESPQWPTGWWECIGPPSG